MPAPEGGMALPTLAESTFKMLGLTGYSEWVLTNEAAWNHMVANMANMIVAPAFRAAAGDFETFIDIVGRVPSDSNMPNGIPHNSQWWYVPGGLRPRMYSPWNRAPGDAADPSYFPVGGITAVVQFSLIYHIINPTTGKVIENGNPVIMTSFPQLQDLVWL
jgi:hypothetical protein